MKGWMSSKKAAEYADVCENTLRAWRGMGLKCYRISGRVVRYKAADIDEFIEGRAGTDQIEDIMGRVRMKLIENSREARI